MILFQRLFFSALVFGVVAAVSSVTTMALKVVQRKRGCLFYPDVCKLRNEIQNVLLPELKSEKNRFIRTFGEKKMLNSTVNDIIKDVSTIHALMRSISVLHTNLTSNFKSIVEVYNSVNIDFPDLKNAVTYYDDWLHAVDVELFQSIVHEFELELIKTMIEASHSIIATAGSVFLSIFTIGFNIVDLVSSIQEEKRVKEDLIERKRKIVNAKRDVQNAFNTMKKFQQEFCTKVVNLLYNISDKGRTNDRTTFDDMYTFLSQTYGTSNTRCDSDAIVSKTNIDILKKFSQQYLQKLFIQITVKYVQLIFHVGKVKKLNAFFDFVKMKVSNLTQPEAIFRSIKLQKPNFSLLQQKKFLNLFDLLRHISFNILHNTSCYWGYNLDDIRSGLISGENYIYAPVCKSPEISSLEATIRSGVTKQEVVCRISHSVEGTVFRTRYHVIRFIADYILPHEECYWGYDLNYIRQSPYRSYINAAKIDSSLYRMMKTRESDLRFSSAKEDLLVRYSVFSSHWQNFILCHIWQHPVALKQLGCAVAYGSCFPAVPNFQTC